MHSIHTSQYLCEHLTTRTRPLTGTWKQHFKWHQKLKATIKYWTCSRFGRYKLSIFVRANSNCCSTDSRQLHCWWPS